MGSWISTPTLNQPFSQFSVVQDVVHGFRLRGADVVERHRVGRAAADAGPPHPWIGGVDVLVPLSMSAAIRRLGGTFTGEERVGR